MLQWICSLCMQYETRLWPSVRLISTQYLAGGWWWTCEKYSPSLYRALLRCVAAFKASADKDLTGMAQDGSTWQWMAHYGLWTLGLQPPDVYTLTLWLRCSVKHQPWAGSHCSQARSFLIHFGEHRHRHRLNIFRVPHHKSVISVHYKVWNVKIQIFSHT